MSAKQLVTQLHGPSVMTRNSRRRAAAVRPSAQAAQGDGAPEKPIKARRPASFDRFRLILPVSASWTQSRAHPAAFCTSPSAPTNDISLLRPSQLATRLVHPKHTLEDPYGAVSYPLYQTATFDQPNATEFGRRAALGTVVSPSSSFSNHALVGPLAAHLARPRFPSDSTTRAAATRRASCSRSRWRSLR